MVGSALVRRLASIDCEVLTAHRRDLDLRDPEAVDVWLSDNRPDVVFLAAGTVGGIMANDTYPADFLYDNLAIATTVIHGAYRAGVPRLVFLGSSCVYPKMAAQPIAEDTLLSGPLEPTNQWYAVAKIAGIKLCQAYRRQHSVDYVSVMPCNLFGPNDNFDPVNSHVMASLMRKIHAAVRDGADSVEIWGSGTPRREFLHVDDLADACVFIVERYSGESPLNIGTGTDVSILELAELIARVAGYQGTFVLDPSKPDGTPKKLLDVSKITALGWQPSLTLEEGLRSAYAWYRESLGDQR
jgi:GDP-L-fucose synthase